MKELRIVGLGLGLSLPLGIFTWIVTYFLVVLVSQHFGFEIASPTVWIKVLLARH